MPSALLRFPGACGIRDFLQGGLRTIARDGDPIAYFARKNIDYIEKGSGLFGCLIAFDPVRFHPVQTRDEHVCIGVNGPVEIDKDVTWIPPRLMKSDIPWDTLKSVEEAQDIIGSSLQEERLAMLDKVNGYFEEVSVLVASDLPLPDVPWFDVSEEERRAILEALNAQSRFTSPVIS